MNVPNAMHLMVMNNIAAGRHETTGFVSDQACMQAMFECILNGWITEGGITALGSQFIKMPVQPCREPPLKGKFYDIVNLGPNYKDEKKNELP